MDNIERQMRARNCPNPDDTPDSLKQPREPIDHPKTIKPTDRHKKGVIPKPDETISP